MTAKQKDIALIAIICLVTMFVVNKVPQIQRIIG